MKIKRQSKILEIIQSNRIETQEELSERLKSMGFRQHRRQYPEISKI